MKEILIYTSYEGSNYFKAFKPYPAFDNGNGITAKVRTERGVLVDVIIAKGHGCVYLHDHQWHIVTPNELWDLSVAVTMLNIGKFKFKEIPFVYWLRNLFKKGE